MSSNAKKFNEQVWSQSIKELIRRASTRLPEDVYSALKGAAEAAEVPRTASILSTICRNADIARANCKPMCQDTGTLTFWVETPCDISQNKIRKAICRAVADATSEGYLRQNTILPIDGKSVPSNVADGAPSIHFEESEEVEFVRISLLMKGGGCENMSAQYSLPDATVGAARDLEGVRACVLHAVWRAQGMGCAPGILGVCIGGDRAEGYANAKRQLLRNLNDESPDDILAQLEAKILEEANTLEIGPMGLGGRPTLLGVKMCGKTRLPASFFVTIAYSCWACRRSAMVIDVATGLEKEVR